MQKPKDNPPIFLFLCLFLFLVSAGVGFAAASQLGDAPPKIIPSELGDTPPQIMPACANLEILIPLYSYPSWYDPDNYIWDEIAAAASRVPVTAVINPEDGPVECPPNSDYQHGLDELRDAGVNILGYVYTSYGNRDTALVQAEVDLYDQCFDIDGIFFDETSSVSADLAYYTGLYNYVKSKPNLDSVVLNPGTQVDEGYLSTPAGDTAVIFENQSSDWPIYLPDAYLSAYAPNRFAMLAYDVPEADTLCAQAALAHQRGLGYVYLTDDDLPNPWDSLPSFWSAELDCLETLNTCAVWMPLVASGE
jgi:hypothetical protein